MTAWSYLEGQVGRIAGHLLTLVPDDPVLHSMAAAALRCDVGDAGALRHALHQARNGLFERSDDAVLELPLPRVVAHLGLSPFLHDVLVMTLAPDVDDHFGAVFSRLRGGGEARRPTLGIVLRALVPASDRWTALMHLRSVRLDASGLVRLGDLDLPYLDRSPAPTEAFAACALGIVPHRLGDGATVEWIDPTDDPDLATAFAHLVGVRKQAEELVKWCRLARSPVVHLRAHEPRSMMLLCRALARGCRAPLLCVRAPRFTQEALREAQAAATLTNAVLVVFADGDEPLVVPPEPAPVLPCLVVTAPEVAVSVSEGRPLRDVVPARPRPIEQVACWDALIGERGTAEVDLLACQTWMGFSDISRAVQLASQHAHMDARGRFEQRDVMRALAELPVPASSYAEVRRPESSWSRLVLDAPTRGRIEELVRRVYHRVTIQDRWGMLDGIRGRGLVALFSGEPGTGKTLAAETVASQLGLPLMTVDLSRLVSKYVGETSKHIAEILDLAEGYRVVLLCDEADALLSTRTGVQNANDRHANFEINYLLQRLELLEGIAILTTNLRQNLDAALPRRLSFSIEFRKPTAELQVAIWERHLPAAQLAADVDLGALARFDMVGGDIRNAALSAAYSAVAHRTPITRALLEAACREELGRRGRTAPP